jgi:hypothetical protein
LSNLPNLNGTISTYNNSLGSTLSGLSTADSPVKLVDINSPFNPYADAYDGLHPNGVGEFKIAKAFANVLSGQFGVGPSFGTIPSSVPDLVPSAPTWMSARAVDAGIKLTWAHSYGVEGYWLYQRNVTLNQPFEKAPLLIPADSWTVNWVASNHTYEFYVTPARGINVGGASPTARVVASPLTAAGPTNIVVTPGAGSLSITWSAPTGANSGTVTGYRVYYKDQAIANSVADMRAVTGTSVQLTGLVRNHSYAIAISSVNAAGEGVPAYVPAATPH